MSIRDDAFNVKPISTFIIDAHTHISAYYANGWYLNPEYTSNNAIIKLMDRLGIDCIITAPHCMVGGFMDKANQLAEEAADNYPGRIYGYISICPGAGIEAVKKNLDRYCDNRKFVGLKLLPGYHGSLHQKEYEYALDFADEAGCPVLCHLWGNNPTTDEVEKVLAGHHKLKLLAAHQGGGNADITRDYGKLMDNYENLYMELCGSLYNTLSLEEIVGIAGENRTVYGSDMINLDPRYDFGRVVLSTLPDEIKKKLLAGNFIELTKKSQMFNSFCKIA